ncbi:signal transducer and activator of transcription 6 isoform X2 [Scleropages formosus]|uniref:Signal transducer and activator of transcription n=2 Tax=Scleropages formosus TaxID=113540 RepID=A0A8C9R5H1_SCLFO|nr:signal transducer and activator of transcription 5B-like isoform X2 [Scleropages formosus]XP_018616053.1 signal transducer and activator of transcription 5B-like isoform X2 [Scleropages formosus]
MMAQWKQVQMQVQFLSTKTLNELYPQTFPMDVRCYLANWIEEQSWEDIVMDSPEQEARAVGLLEQITSLLQDLAQRNPNVVEKLRLQQFSRNMSVFRSQPLQLVKTVQDILRKERVLLSQTVSPVSHFSPSPAQPSESNRDVDVLVLKVLEIQSCRQKIHQLQEELNWERQNFESLQVQLQSHPSNGLDPNLSEQVVKLQSHIQQLEFNGKAIAKTRVQLLQDAVCCLEQCQSRLVQRIQAWRREQHLATIGAPFDDNLGPLQTWCEQLFGVNLKLKQEVLIEPIAELQEKLGLLLQTLVQSSLTVDKQPPQVIKTQSKFSTTVRYLLGEKVAPGKPVLLKAQIVTEAQARNLGQLGTIPSENVGELINNTAILEHNASTKSTCATFRNMSIKKIKRADRKGSESVTEEKFALLFSTEINITGCDTPFRIQMISLPVVVIVHGSQDNNALATIIWDCAFSEPDRVPFVVPERVPWKQMCMTLDSKFTSEVQTQRHLDRFNQHFLAQKIFDKPDISGDYSNMLVSWAQFNKEVLPGRPFTFWQWFDGVMELTKKHLKSYWSDGLIFGFIGKQHLHLILQDRPNGTFLLRFSDSEIGGITIAYVAPSENGGRKIQNIQPFTKRDLEIRCLGDRIRDIELITHVYPDFPKNDAFKKYYTDDSQPLNHGYIGVTMQTKVAGDTHPTSPSVPSMTPRSETPQDPSLLPSHTSYPPGPVFSNMDPMRNGSVPVTVPVISPFFSPQQFQPSFNTDSRVPPGPFHLDPVSIGLFPDLSEPPQQSSMEFEDILDSEMYRMSS